MSKGWYPNWTDAVANLLYVALLYLALYDNQTSKTLGEPIQMPRMGHRFRGFADPKPLGYPGIYRDDAGDEWPGGERLWSPVERSYRE